MVAACSDAPATSTIESPVAPSTSTQSPGLESPTTTVAPIPDPTTTTAAPSLPSSIAGTFEVQLLDIVGEQRLIALADTPELRSQGLMFVEDMADLDGMLFVFDSDSSGGFWMKNTLIQLDIAFFDSDGGFVDGFEMEPCTTPSCPSYTPSGAYRYALEMAAGEMPEDVAEVGLGDVGDL